MATHGTITAYQQHRKGEACDPCLEAWATYQAGCRATHTPSPEAVENEKRKRAARARALWRLRLENDPRYQELYIEELNGGDPDD